LVAAAQRDTSVSAMVVAFLEQLSGRMDEFIRLEALQRFRVQDLTSGIMMAALEARQRFQLSYWDAAIIEASRSIGCTEVLSEDLNDGQDYGGVRVTNPFSARS
jgi:predicted nucleic acid-binding protein